MIPENLQKLREQISLDCFKADPNCLYDATELNLLIVEMTREHSVTKAMLEKGGVFDNLEQAQKDAEFLGNHELAEFLQQQLLGQDI